MKLRKFAKFAVLYTASLVLAFGAHAEDSSHRLLTIIVPYAAGTLPDIFARAMSQDVGELLKRPVIVDNRPGAGEVVAGTYMARAPADGSVLMMTTLPNVVSPAIQQRLPYGGISDFAAIVEPLRVVPVLVAAPTVPARNYRELVEILKKNPGKLSYGSSGIGSAQHLMLEQLSLRTNTQSVHVPYKSFQSAVTDLVAGRIDYTMAPVNMAIQYAKEGKLKILGALSNNRLADAPDIPTLGEQVSELRDQSAFISYGLLAPKGTPAGVVAKLNGAFSAVLASAGFADRVNRTVGGVQISGPETPSQVAASLAKQEAHWRAVAKEAHVQFE